MHNPEKDALQVAENRRKLLGAGYRLFTEKTIDGVSLEMVAKAAVTRYAVGLAYQPEGEAAAEEELVQLRNMLLGEYSQTA